MAKSKAQDLDKEAVWRRAIRERADSGLSVRSWCHKHGLKESAFYWWRRELARRDTDRRPLVRRETEKQATSFVPVHVTEGAARAAGPQLEIVLTDGRCVRVTGPVNREMLTEVLDVLTSTSSLRSEHSGSKTVEPEHRAC
jgi:transposase-like protein